MLAVQRQVVGKLVDQQPGDEADVGTAAFEDTRRDRWADDLLAVLELDHRPPVLEDNVAPWPLGEAIAVLVADDLEFFRGQSFGLRHGHLDDCDRNLGRIEEGQRLGIRRLGGLLRTWAAPPGRDRGVP